MEEEGGGKEGSIVRVSDGTGGTMGRFGWVRLWDGQWVTGEARSSRQ
jgi:hypothetical protein